MQKILLAALAVLFVAGSAPAVMMTEELWNDASGIASQMSLDLSLPEGGLAAYWPGEVEKLTDLPPIVATIKNPTKLNAAIGEGANLAKGDFVVLYATGARFGARFYSRDAVRVNTALNRNSPEMFQVLAALHVSFTSPLWGSPQVWNRGRPPHNWDHLGTFNAKSDAFAEAFTGEGEIADNQVVIIRPGEKTTTAFLVHEPGLGDWSIGLVEGAVKLTRK